MLISAQSYVAADLFYDIFKCLNKNELEKCQLVSTYWNNIILNHENLLAVRVLKLLDLNHDHPVYQANDGEETFTLDPEFSVFTPFKKCIFETIEISESVLWMASKIPKEFNRLVQKLHQLCSSFGHPIHAIRLKFSMGYLNMLETFKTYVEFTEIQFRGRNDYLKFVEQRPMELDGLKVRFTNFTNVQRYTMEDDAEFLIIASGKELSDSKRMTIEKRFQGSDDAIFCQDFVKAFIESKPAQIANFIREIHFQEVWPMFPDHILKLAKDHGLLHRKLRSFSSITKNTFLETFAIRRHDAWAMTIAFHKKPESKSEESFVRPSQWNDKSCVSFVTNGYIFVHEQGSCPDTLNKIIRSY